MDQWIRDISTGERPHEYLSILGNLIDVLECNNGLLNCIGADLVDKEFLDEIDAVITCGTVGVYFGKTLRHLKIVIADNGLRNHEIYFQYKGPGKLVVTNVNLPHSAIQNTEYKCLDDLIEAFSNYINDLARYFDELEHLHRCCTIMEPINATFKDEYRRILIDDRTWLHIEVTPEGLATNVHLVGQSGFWHNKLQSGLLHWDHDKNIVDNILYIFDLNNFPEITINTSEPAAAAAAAAVAVETNTKPNDQLICGICLSASSAESPSVPQPLCQNSICGVHYHRNCLYQWLVACAGSRPPAFGVANGACPTCLQPISCSEKEN